MEKNQIRLIISLGFLVMLVQHFCIIIIPFVLPNLTIQIFYLDLIGFFIIGIGYALFFTTMSARKNLYLGAGISFVLWTILTLVWRIITDFYGIAINTSDTNTTFNTFLDKLVSERLLFSVSAMLAALFLFVGSLLIFKAHGGAGAMMLVAYSLINFIGMILVAAPIYLLPQSEVTNIGNLAIGVVFGLFLKIILVPILGLISFLILLLKTSDITRASDIAKTGEVAKTTSGGTTK